MEKRIIDKLVEIWEAQTNHIGKQWRISGHTYRGSTSRVTLIMTFVTTLVSTTQISVSNGGGTRLGRCGIIGRNGRIKISILNIGTQGEGVRCPIGT